MVADFALKSIDLLLRKGGDAKKLLPPVKVCLFLGNSQKSYISCCVAPTGATKYGSSCIAPTGANENNRSISSHRELRVLRRSIATGIDSARQEQKGACSFVSRFLEDFIRGGGISKNGFFEIASLRASARPEARRTTIGRFRLIKNYEFEEKGGFH